MHDRLVVTVTAVLTGPAAGAEGIADALLADGTVTTVYHARGKLTVRVDALDKRSPEEAARQALEPLERLPRTFDVDVRVTSVGLEEDDPQATGMTGRRPVPLGAADDSAGS